LNQHLIEIENSFSLARGEHLFVRGPSGSGKSTLLGLLTGILTPVSGHLSLMQQDTAGLSATRRDRLRADHIGYIFQQFNLVPYLDLVEN
jgi:putative ABC transport system ATP-binding protein